MHAALLISALLLLVCLLPMAARKLRVSAPILLFLVGGALGLIPGVAAPHVPPDVILPICLPPLLFGAAYYTSWRDFRANLRAILLLAVGLVGATALALAGVMMWLVPGMTLAAGLLLGAIVSPPDAVAATAVMKQLRVPRRILTILEGESLVNDASGLVLYELAVGAVAVGSFDLAPASLHFVWLCIGGIGLGTGCGWLSARAFPFLVDTRSRILFTMVMPYLAYSAAELIHASGVLSVVAAGLVVGWRAPHIFPSSFRVPAEAVWDMFAHTLTSAVFLLVGLESSYLVARVAEHYDWYDLVRIAGICALVMVSVRVLWVFAFAYGWRILTPRKLRERRGGDPFPHWQNVFLITWSGMRGVVSMALALAVPLTMRDGSPFPHRDLLLFVAPVLIIFSLVIQGGTLPWLVRHLRLAFDTRILQEDWEVRRYAAEQALATLKAACAEGEWHEPAMRRLISHYKDRLLALGDGPNTPIGGEDAGLNEHPVIQAERELWIRALAAEREAVLRQRASFAIGDDTMHDILRQIDTTAQRFAPDHGAA